MSLQLLAPASSLSMRSVHSIQPGRKVSRNKRDGFPSGACRGRVFHRAPQKAFLFMLGKGV